MLTRRSGNVNISRKALHRGYILGRICIMIEKCRRISSGIIESRWFIPAMCALTGISMCIGINLAGAMVLVALAMWLLLFSDDTFAVLCPVMFTVMCLTSFYDDYFALLDYIWMVVPFVVAFVVHIFAYRDQAVRGRFIWSLAAVSVALIVGGIGVIPIEEYFSGVALYYMLGLGVLLLLIYLLMCSRLSRPRNYDLIERFAALLYGMAILAAVIIILFYVRNWQSLMPDFKTPFISYRNFCTTVMLFGLPMCCLFVRKNPVHLVSIALIYFVMLVGGSRSALLFGTFELMLCLVYVYLRSDADRRRTYRRIALICAVPVVLIGGYLIYSIFIGESGRMSEHFIRPAEARPKFYRQGVIDFLAEPILGYGIGNMKNADIYQGVNGSIIFYHNSTLQVMASMGLVGCVAYGYQLFERVRMLWVKRHTDALLMAIPFIGVLLMSQTNPGSFCPLPTGVLLVLMFAVVEFENSQRDAE